MLNPSKALATPEADYDVIRRVILALTGPVRLQPDLDRLGAGLKMSPEQIQSLIHRWCGLSFDAFTQTIMPEHALAMLADRADLAQPKSQPQLKAGLLHEITITVDLSSQASVKQRGQGIELAYGFHPTPFGEALLLATRQGVAGLAFRDEDKAQSREQALADMTARWPSAIYDQDEAVTAPLAMAIFEPSAPGAAAGLNLVLIGTGFEVRVWQSLAQIPVARAITYKDIACHLGDARASRAVGTAVGRNPISFVVPCHRVIRGDGGLGGYHWGLTRKRAMIAWEAGWAARR